MTEKGVFRLFPKPSSLKGDFMADWILISVFGRDRPGIVANVSRILYQNSCNIEELSQTAIKGQFAMILIASSSRADSIPQLKEDIGLLSQDLGLEINLRKIQEEEMAPYNPEDTEPFILIVRGEDRPGLVYGITEVLAERGINITNLDAKVARVGQKLEYIQLFEVDVPRKLDYGLVQEKLAARGKEMGVKVDLQHRGIFRTMNQI
jgi:glycine cleavage system transcriptional repressor